MDQIGIFYIVYFDWPEKMSSEVVEYAKELHVAVNHANWIEEILAASGGIGGQQSSVWIFRLANYGQLDQLLRETGDSVHKAYQKFFNEMTNVEDLIREEVNFL